MRTALYYDRTGELYLMTALRFFVLLYSLDKLMKMSKMKRVFRFKMKRVFRLKILK